MPKKTRKTIARARTQTRRIGTASASVRKKRAHFKAAQRDALRAIDKGLMRVAPLRQKMLLLSETLTEPLGEADKLGEIAWQSSGQAIFPGSTFDTMQTSASALYDAINEALDALAADLDAEREQIAELEWQT